MKIIDSIREYQGLLESIARPTGLVPTMGFLHEGHRSIVQEARLDNASVTATIFVNPRQFSPAEDFEKYPRDPEADIELLDSEGVDFVFMPSVEEVYPDGFDTTISVGSVAARLEGKYRPSHFQGVATVVCKLFCICRPDRAYFGQKDIQQCAVVNRLNVDLNLGVEVVVVPTVRDDDGLAISSRNVYLSSSEREAALFISRSLFHVLEMWRSGEKKSTRLKSYTKSMLGLSPLLSIDYVSIADPQSIKEVKRAAAGSVVAIAARIGKTRLIDNITLE